MDPKPEPVLIDGRWYDIHGNLLSQDHDMTDDEFKAVMDHILSEIPAGQTEESRVE